MRRRDTLAFILAFCATPRTGRGQQAKAYRVAWLSGTAIAAGDVWTEFVAGMRELGWIEGQNFIVENLRYEGRSERLSAVAAEAVQRSFDLIICAGTPPAVAARDATTTIPIVFYFVGDPMGAGLVASLARPGGNITGLGGLGPGVYGKMLELLIDAVPTANRIAMLANSSFSLHAGFGADAEAAARKMKLTLKSVELRSPEDIDSAFATIARDKADAVLILGQPFLFGQGARVARMAIEQRLPAMIPFEQVVHDGILMSYGTKVLDDIRRLPYYLDRILKGGSPATLPVEQPSRFYLTINLKTAKAIGVTVPTSLLQRADLLIK